MSTSIGLDPGYDMLGSKDGKVPRGLKVTLYILSGIEIVFALAMIAGGVVDMLIDAGEYNTTGVMTLAFLCVPIGLVTGICSAIATRHVHSRTALTWTVVNWAGFALLFLVLIALLLHLVTVVSVSVLGTMLVFKLIYCVMFTYLNTRPPFSKSGC